MKTARILPSQPVLAWLLLIDALGMLYVLIHELLIWHAHQFLLWESTWLGMIARWLKTG